MYVKCQIRAANARRPKPHMKGERITNSKTNLKIWAVKDTRNDSDCSDYENGTVEHRRGKVRVITKGGVNRLEELYRRLRS